MEININAPKAILKTTNGAMLMLFLRYPENALVSITILIGNHYAKIGRHIGLQQNE